MDTKEWLEMMKQNFIDDCTGEIQCISEIVDMLQHIHDVLPNFEGKLFRKPLITKMVADYKGQGKFNVDKYNGIFIRIYNVKDIRRINDRNVFCKNVDCCVEITFRKSIHGCTTNEISSKETMANLEKHINSWKTYIERYRKCIENYDEWKQVDDEIVATIEKYRNDVEYFFRQHMTEINGTYKYLTMY